MNIPYTPNIDSRSFAPGGEAHLAHPALSFKSYNVPQTDVQIARTSVVYPPVVLCSGFRLFSAETPHRAIEPAEIFSHHAVDLGPLFVTGDITLVSEHDVDDHWVQPVTDGPLVSGNLTPVVVVDAKAWLASALRVDAQKYAHESGRLMEKTVLVTDLVELPVPRRETPPGEEFCRDHTFLAAFTPFACFVLWRPHDTIRPQWHAWMESQPNGWFDEERWEEHPYAPQSLQPARSTPQVPSVYINGRGHDEEHEYDHHSAGGWGQEEREEWGSPTSPVPATGSSGRLPEPVPWGSIHVPGMGSTNASDVVGWRSHDGRH